VIIDFYNRGGGSGGVTTGEVQTMIDNSISGKADTSAVTTDLASKQNYYTASTLTDVTNPQEGDICIVSEVATEIEGANPNNVDFLDTVAGKKVRVAFNSEGLTNNTIAGYTINNSGYWGWGYTASTVNSRNTTTGDWESWNGSNYEYTFPSQITSYNRNIGNNTNVWLQRSTISIVEENVAFNFINGQWIRLLDTVQEMVNQGVEGLYSISQTVENANWSGKTPSYYGDVLEGTICNNNGVYGEVFNAEDVFLERKGVYQRSFSGTTDLSATTGNEGDTYQMGVEGTGSTYVTIEWSDFLDLFKNGGWVAGATYKVSADTSTSPNRQMTLVGEFTVNSNRQNLGLGWSPDPGFYYNMFQSDYDAKTSWDGSELTITIPEYSGYRVISYMNEGYLANYVTVKHLEREMLFENYTMVNGEWVKLETVIELTLAEYTALTSYTKDATYVITDAQSVDLSTLATKTEVDGKVDKVSGITANANDLKFPKWNDQGIVTGYTTQTYERTLTLNGSGVQFIGGSNITFFAPTSAGSAAQPLLSNGSGAPVWASFKLWKGNQTAYDAITTKDNDTIYFVVDD